VLFFDSGVDISVYMPYARTYCIWCSLFYIPLAMIFIYRNTMQGCGWGKTALMLGISELFARLACAITAMELHNFTFAAGADAIAWIVAGVLSYFLYRFVISSEEKRKIRAQSEIRHDDV
jgi:Na+-driven multidrug efflux pump